MQVLDSALDSRMSFTTLFDLNAYLPAHNSKYTREWTGNPATDLANNRTKRSFLDNPVLARATRHGLGRELPAARLSRAEIERAGCDLREPERSGRDYLVQTYARDTGAVMVALSLPLYVKGHRFGCVAAAWEPSDGRTE